MTTTKKRGSSPAATPTNDNRNLPAVRLAAPQTALAELGLDIGTWKVLTESIFPSAKTPEGVMLAVRYCQAKNLDIMRRPVHVVPMWSKALGREVETVWPGISEIQTTAARTGQWAGMDPPRFGTEMTRTFKGRAKNGNEWQDMEVTVTFPEWAEVTVYRIVHDTRCPFTETVFWEETYSRFGGARSELPTDMWVKRPRGQLVKCAKAASLRAAFPEETDYTAEEMEGKTLESGSGPIREAVVINAAHAEQPQAGSTDTGIPESEPSHRNGDMQSAIEDEVCEQIDKLVTRATRSNAWASAEEYFRGRYQGDHLEYALRELEHAKAEASPDRAAA